MLVPYRDRWHTRPAPLKLAYTACLWHTTCDHASPAEHRLRPLVGGMYSWETPCCPNPRGIIASPFRRGRFRAQCRAMGSSSGRVGMFVGCVDQPHEPQSWARWNKCGSTAALRPSAMTCGVSLPSHTRDCKPIWHAAPQRMQLVVNRSGWCCAFVSHTPVWHQGFLSVCDESRALAQPRGLHQCWSLQLSWLHREEHHHLQSYVHDQMRLDCLHRHRHIKPIPANRPH